MARVFRGRLPSPVTLWMAGEGKGRVGLTVSSVVVALGEPAMVVGLVDPDSELALALPELFTVTVLGPDDRALADVFGGVAPAPAGEFAQAEFSQTPWGPTLAGHSWLGARVLDRREVGWSVEIRASVERVDLSEFEPVVHHRGQYRALGPRR